MNTFEDYYIKKLYPLQDGIIKIVSSLHTPFYQTGGTALSRGYLNHRFSDDLDFFVNQEEKFLDAVRLIINEIDKNSEFKIERSKISITDDFAQFFINEDDIILKIDFVNDIPEYFGQKKDHKILGKIDSIENILTNKISAIFRHEPKDIADLWCIANNYCFNWETAINHAKEKEIGIDPVIIAEIINSFPIERISYIKWVQEPDETKIMRDLKVMVDEILQGKKNSLNDLNPKLHLSF